MDKEAAITAALREKYSPVAVILHGSRAVGKQRPRSDWDIVLLVGAKPAPAIGREEIAGEDVEWQAFMAPLPEDAFLGVFGVQLQFSKLLWEDASGAGTALLRQAHSVYAKGVALTDATKLGYKQYLVHKINGMEDDIDTPYLFLRHQHTFLERASNWWFEMRGEFRKPLYIAMPTIEARDPQYHDLLMQISAAGPHQAKIDAARHVVSRLFA